MSDKARTADGVVVAIGDIIWTVRDYGSPTRRKVCRVCLKVWSWWRMHESAYADELAAYRAASQQATKALANAKRDVKRETQRLAKLTAHLATLDIPTRTDRGREGR